LLALERVGSYYVHNMVIQIVPIYIPVDTCRTGGVV
jgi:hypothetical protein